MTTAVDGRAVLSRWGQLFGLIRFSHTLFALPFAILATWMAACNPLPGGAIASVGWRQWLGVLVCMTFARSVAMAFNRLVDRRFDAENPRTSGRHLPAGLLTAGEVAGFILVSAIGFIAGTLLFLPNRIPFFASVPVLAWLCGYSLAKRFTAAAHLWLGVALALAPLCAWLAIRGWWGMSDLVAPAILSAGITTWVSGFDIIYACQDADYDSSAGLHSIPARFGVAGGLRIAAGLHGLTVAILLAFPVLAPGSGLGAVWLLAVVGVASLLAYEHAIVSASDLQRVNVAFFNVNVAISLVLMVAGGVDCYLG